MQEYTKLLDGISRRRLMAYAAKSLLGVSVFPSINVLGAPQSTGKGKAKHVIYLFMNGAMSQLDTFDPKPGVDEQGPTKSIKTNVSGIEISEHFPQLSKLMDKVTLIRSMSTVTGAHRPGVYLMRTSYKEIATIRHPSLGSWIQKLDGKLNDALPGSVVIGADSQHPYGGFFEANFAPVPIGNPATGLENTKPPQYLSDSQFAKRMTLAELFDSAFQRKYKHRDVQAYTQLYGEAVRLLKSSELKAFDLNEEPEKIRQQYGSSRIGQGCLLARRLIEAKVRFVEVTFGSWDDHREVFDNLPTRAQSLDQALSALLTDLESKGMRDSTLIVLGSEFGRTPNINQNMGRDHHPGAYTTLLAGGGTKGGMVWGTTDEIAFSVEEDNVTPQDFNATIAYALGLNLEEEVFSPSGRPFTIARGGSPLTKLF